MYYLNHLYGGPQRTWKLNQSIIMTAKNILDYGTTQVSQIDTPQLKNCFVLHLLQGNHTSNYIKLSLFKKKKKNEFNWLY